MPYSIPYIQLHGVWHIASCLLIYYVIFIMMLYQANIVAVANNKVKDGDARLVVKINDKTWFQDIFPVVHVQNKRYR